MNETTRCPGCDTPVIPTGRVLLDAQPDPLGVYRADGTPMRESEFRRFWDAVRPVGRRVHVCGRDRVGGVR